MTRVLLTGGAGFIGSHVADRLIAAGNHVRILDNFSTGKYENIPDCCEVLAGDIADSTIVRTAMDGVDGVIHLAAVASVPKSVADPVGTNSANLVGTIRLLEAARAAGVKRFVFASSASIYGSAAGERGGAPHPIPETATALPQTPYAIDKYASEKYGAFFHAERGMNVTSFRFFNIFGERQDPSSPYSGVISIFVDRMQRGEDIFVHGDGRQTRDFVYVKDLANILVTELGNTARPTRMPVYNVGSGLSTSLIDILGALTAVSQLTPRVHFGDSRIGDIRHSLADPRRLHSAFPEQSFTPFGAGLKALWDWSISSAK